MTDVLEDESPNDQDSEAQELHVCKHPTDDGGICGEDFPDKRRLNLHMMNKHRVTIKGDAIADRKKATKTKAPADKRPSTVKTPKTPITGPVFNRPVTYAASITTMATIAHFGTSQRFPDPFDYKVITNGATPLATALDAVGEQNESVRTVCDIFLGGGANNPYVQLILASAMIAVPICAHHGWLPAAAGQAVGGLVGVVASDADVPLAPSPPTSEASPEREPTADAQGLPGRIEDWSLQDWMMSMQRMNPDVMQEFMGIMPGGPIVTTIPPMPGTEPMDIREEHDRGAPGTESRAEPEPVR